MRDHEIQELQHVAGPESRSMGLFLGVAGLPGTPLAGASLRMSSDEMTTGVATGVFLLPRATVRMADGANWQRAAAARRVSGDEFSLCRSWRCSNRSCTRSRAGLAVVAAVWNAHLHAVGLGSTVAVHAHDAVELAPSHSGLIDVLLSDLVMPGLRARELAHLV